MEEKGRTELIGGYFTSWTEFITKLKLPEPNQLSKWWTAAQVGLKNVDLTDIKLVSAGLGISVATYMYIKLKGTQEQKKILQQELRNAHRASENFSDDRRHRQDYENSGSSNDHEDEDESSSRHMRHSLRVSNRRQSSNRRQRSHKRY